MTPEQTALLTPEERAAWEACEGAPAAPWIGDRNDGTVKYEVLSSDLDAGGNRDPVIRGCNNNHEPPYGLLSDGAERFVLNARTSLPAALTTIANLRADYAEAQARYGRAWEALCTIGDAVDKAGHYTLIPERALQVGVAVDALIAERDELRDHLRKQQDAFVVGLEVAQRTADAEIAELKATIANEAGQGPPPSEGWEWDEVDGGWMLRTAGSPLALVERWTSSTHERPYWTVATDKDYSRETPYPNARAAMKAADLAIKEPA